MTKEQVIREFNDQLNYLEAYMGDDKVRERFSTALSSLQESTESRVREELRAAVEKLKMEEYHSCPVYHEDGKKDCEHITHWITHNRAINEVLSLLQDPKKQ